MKSKLKNIKEKIFNKSATNIHEVTYKLPLKYIWLYVGLTVIIFIAAFFYYQFLKNEIIKIEYAELKEINEIRINEINNWFDFNISDSKAHIETGDVVNLLDNYIERNDIKSKQKLQNILSVLGRHLNCDRLFIINSNMEMILDNSGFPQTNIDNKKWVERAIEIGTVQYSDIYKEEHSPLPEVELIIPLKSLKNKNNIEKLFLLIEVNLNRKLSREKSSENLVHTLTGESMLVELKDSTVIVINRLRQTDNEPLELDIPVKTSDLSIFDQLLFGNGILKGTDYRNREVIAVIKKVPRFNWHLITKIDEAEILRPVEEKSQLLVLFILSIITVLGFVFNSNSKKRKSNYYKNLLNLNIQREIAEDNLVKSEKRLKEAQMTSLIGSWEFDFSTETCFWSDELYSLFGYSPNEIHCSKQLFEERIVGKYLYEFSENMNNALNYKKSFEMDIQYKTKTGKIRFANIIAKVTEDKYGEIYLISGTFQDINERKINENALRISSDKLTSAEKIARMGFMNWDFKTNQLELSGGCLDLFGIKKNGSWFALEFITQYIHPQDKEYVTRNLELAQKTGRNYNIEHRIVRSDGSELNVKANSETFLSQNNVPSGLLITLFDITTLKETENRVLDLNRILVAIRNINQHIIIENDSSKLLNKICTEFTNTWGYDSAWIVVTKKGQILGLGGESNFNNNFELYKNHIISDLDLHCTSVELANTNINILTNREQFCGTCPLYMYEPKENILAVRLSLGDEEYGMLKVAVPSDYELSSEARDLFEGVASDIAFGLQTIESDMERKIIEDKLHESEERYKKFFEEDLSADYISTPEGTILECNSAFVRMFGFKTKEEVIAANFYDFYPEKTGRNNFLDDLKKVKKIEYSEEVLLNKFGEDIHVIKHSIGEFNSDGKLETIQGYLVDITKLKQTKEKLILAKEEAEKANKLKSEFLAQISHEIRTPVNSILSFSSLLKSELIEQLPDDLMTSFSIIDRAGKRLIRTIDLILNMSEIQTGTYEAVLRNVNIHDEVLAPLFIDFRQAANDKKLDFNFKVDSKKNDCFVDEYTTKQIFTNLIDNAIKYTKKGSITLSLFESSDKNLVAEVIDTGIGMAEDYLPEIFTMFSQEQQGYTRKFEGNGLGLALVKKYSEINNASIEVESKKGKGSTFRVIFNKGQNNS